MIRHLNYWLRSPTWPPAANAKSGNISSHFYFPEFSVYHSAEGCHSQLWSGSASGMWHIRDSVQVFQKTFLNSTEMYSHICGKFLTNQNTETRWWMMGSSCRESWQTSVSFILEVSGDCPQQIFRNVILKQTDLQIISARQWHHSFLTMMIFLRKLRMFRDLVEHLYFTTGTRQVLRKRFLVLITKTR